MTPIGEPTARIVGRVKVDPTKHLSVKGERLVGADFGGRRLDSFAAVGAHFEGCSWNGARIEDASFGAGREQSVYVDCTFDGARLRLGPGGNARFERCSFRNVKLRDWFCFQVEMIDCVFSGTLNGGYFNGTVPDEDRPWAKRAHNEFRGNDFAELKLVDVAWRTGIDLSLQRLPTGPEYFYVPDAAAATRAARARIVRWTDLELRREALVFLTSLEGDVAQGQRQFLLREADYGKRFVQSTRAVFEAMRA